MNLSIFPTINASLNFSSAVLLLIGFFFIRRGNVPAHRMAMGAAFATSVLFLASYLYYHYHAGSKPYEGVGLMRPVYFSILISHTILATAIVPLILTTLTFALRGRFDRHRAWAKWTWPLWMYVSVTGVVIYAMLYL
jgi:uncharacterized membrane protein YozB (DUF420 family)